MPDHSFTVDLAALQKAAKGVTDTVQSIKDDDVSDWLPSESQVGHDTVWTALDTFGSRWNVGMENLTNDVEEVGQRLTQVLTTYADYDTASTNRMKRSVKAAGATHFPSLGAGSAGGGSGGSQHGTSGSGGGKQ